jgi:hypothetical protein
MLPLYTRLTMNHDPLIVAARALALLWYSEQVDATYRSEAEEWAWENFIAFLPDATELLGRSLLGEVLSVEEQLQAEADLARAEASYKRT